jgi:hypothetical protein
MQQELQLRGQHETLSMRDLRHIKTPAVSEVLNDQNCKIGL